MTPLSFHLVETLFAAYKTLLEKEFKDSLKISTLVSHFTKACRLITSEHPKFEQINAMCKEVAKNNRAENLSPLQKISKYIDDKDHQMAQACVRQYCHLDDERLQGCKTHEDYFYVLAQTLNQLGPLEKRDSNANCFSSNRYSVFEHANPATSDSDINEKPSKKQPFCAMQ